MRLEPHKLAAIGLVASSMLVHQILLTRVCALRLFFHFAFVVISNCLLGMGASGTLLTLYQDKWRKKPRHWLGVFTMAYTASLVVTYFVLLLYPIPGDLSLSKPSHLFSFSLFSLLGAIPFVFGGTVVGMLLSFNAEQADRLYGVDLVAAGLACLGCPFLLGAYGAGGVFVVSVLLALVAAVVVVRGLWGNRALFVGAALGLFGLFLVPTLDGIFPVPSKGYLDFLRAIEAKSGDAQFFSRWTANSRIDLVTPPAGTEEDAITTRGRVRDGLPPAPEHRAILQDAAAGTVVVNFSDHPEALEILRRAMYSASVRLRPDARVFIIGLGGGNDVWAAKAADASFIRAVELNAPIVDIHRTTMRRFSRLIVEDPNIELIVSEGRAALMRESAKYDVIQMTGIDTWTALTSGAYVLAENYLYTQEAIETMYSRLADGGILQITRFAETMEGLRLLANVNAAFESLGVENIHNSVMMIRATDKLMAVQIKKGAFTDEEQSRTWHFAYENGLDVAYIPNIPTGNYFNQFLRTDAKKSFIEAFPRNISPTSDDRPYFFNYSRWSDPVGSRQHSDIASVSQGNPFFILSQLLASIFLAGALVVLPLARRRVIPRRGARRYLTYFAGLGLGFIFIEIALMQKLTLFLGQPVYSLTVTLFSLLVFTGLGSLLLAGRIGTNERRIWLVPVALAVVLAIIVVSSPWVTSSFIGLPLTARIAITLALLAPVGLLLGVPFAYGLRVLQERNPALTPWAWAVNGCFSVVGSILTVVLSMNFGFSAVLALAAGIYLVAFAALRREIALGSVAS